MISRYNFLRDPITEPSLPVIKALGSVMLFRQKQPPEVFCKRGVLRNFAKFTGKHLFQRLFFNKESLAQVFPVNFAKFLRTPFLQNTSGRLLLFRYELYLLVTRIDKFEQFRCCAYSSNCKRSINLYIVLQSCINIKESG